MKGKSEYPYYPPELLQQHMRQVEMLNTELTRLGLADELEAFFDDETTTDSRYYLQHPNHDPDDTPVYIEFTSSLLALRRQKVGITAEKVLRTIYRAPTPLI